MTLGWRSGEPRSWSTSQASIELKNDMQLPWSILRSSIMSKTTKTPLRNLQRPFRLHDDALETHRRWSISQEGRDKKIDMQLPWCILQASIMSKTVKNPLRNHQRPLRLQGWHFDDALENPGVRPLSGQEEIWKFICSFLNVSLRHSVYQKPPRLLSGTPSILLDS